LGAGAATAALLPGAIGTDWQEWILSRTNPLEDILNEFKNVDSILETAMERVLGDAWRRIQDSIGSSSPNPSDVRTASDDVTGGVLSNSPVVSQRDLANLYDQEVARTMAAPLLGEAGEEYLLEETEEMAEVIERSQQGATYVQQLAEQSQGLTVTQDVMKAQAEMDGAIAALLAQQTQLSADNHIALMQSQRLQSILAQLSANTSEGIDESNRRERVERQVQIIGATQAPIYIPGLLGTGDDDSSDF
jgi:transcriptional regulator with GAF, ATPase, and Fis domain